MTPVQPKTIIGLSVLIGSLVTLASLVGIYTPDFYSRETLNWQLQAGAQDIVDLVLVVPLLVVTALLTFSNRRAASLLWAGALLYLVYTLVIYCFDVHFNSLFVIYCITLGLSGYAFLYFLFTHLNAPSITMPVTGLVLRIIGCYFIIVSFSFWFLWLSEIIPAIWNNSIPASLVEVGLPTNAVHVLDLSFLLPGVFLTGVLILKKNPIGITLAPVILTFFILMDISIAVIVVVMKRGGIGENFSVAIIMGVLALLSLALLTWYLQYTKTDESK